jgi:Apea-like HEPN
MEEKDEAQSYKLIPGVWAFVLNRIVIEAELPFELAPECFIDKASEEQRILIKSTLNDLVGKFSFTKPDQEYESELVLESTQNSQSSHYEPLPKSDWRYYVVTTPDNGLTNINLNYVSNLSEVPLELGGLHFFKNAGIGFNPGVLQNHFGFGSFAPTKRISKELLLDLSNTYRSFMELTNGISGETDFPEILRAMGMFDSLHVLHPNSEFHVLGLFAIIEMLITHNPKLEDRGDSITHQMQSKIPLLSRRFDRPLEFASFFHSTDEKKIWSALYKYRSALAHGGISNFQHKELKPLKDANNAKAFLKEVVKALLRHSLKEPQLFKDLRGC